jgi:hypothetical protein
MCRMNKKNKAEICGQNSRQLNDYRYQFSFHSLIQTSILISRNKNMKISGLSDNNRIHIVIYNEPKTPVFTFDQT